VKKWEESSIGSIAMGHEIGVTSMQLAQACSVIASGGLLVKPRLVSGGEREKPAPRTRVIRPETAITMRNMMEGVVIKPVGTGFKYARIPGYTAAGKTGTAQIYDYKRREYTHFYNASFMGFAPVTNPAIVVVVTVNGATGTAGYGGPAAAPVFRDVAAAALRLLDIPKTLPETFTDTEDVSADTNDLAIAGLGSSVPPPLVQPADTTDDRPAASARVALDQRLFSSAIADTSNQLSGPKVPSFLGMTARDVAEKSAAIGLPIESVGSGLVRAQYPSPGGLLPLGEKVRVQFGR
jgi:cell division protein FtsI (penicillin-binding protein 3)